MIDFNERADGVAPQLLGAVIWRGEVGIQLTEVEAYLGEADAASHAFKGPTPRCATMFGPPGHLYVYASYGIHRAGNLVCSPEGEAGGVLLRAGRVVAGHDLVQRRRGMQIDDAKLASGPGTSGRAWGWTCTSMARRCGSSLGLAYRKKAPVSERIRRPARSDWQVQGRVNTGLCSARMPGRMSSGWTCRSRVRRSARFVWASASASPKTPMRRCASGSRARRR